MNNVLKTLVPSLYFAHLCVKAVDKCGKALEGSVKKQCKSALFVAGFLLKLLTLQL